MIKIFLTYFIMNLESIQTRINSIKRIRKFDEKDYLSILDDFDKIYNNKKNSYFNFEDLNYILDKKENFRLYLIENLFRIANEKAKNEDYDNSLEVIKKLKKIMKSSENEYLNNIEKINSFCLFKKKLLEGIKMIEKKEFKNAIKYYKNLIQLTKDFTQIEIYKRYLITAKNEFIQNILNENINLLHQKKYDEIIKKCEEILNEFQYESKLKNIINETKKLYKKTLEEKIEENLNKNKICFNEMKKYQSLIEMENTNENKINEFEEKIIQISNSKNNNINKISLKKINININNINSSLISLDIINKYLEQIKYLNEGNLSEDLEKDIKNQIENYNNEIYKNNIDIKEWLIINKEKITNSNFRGNIFAIFNIINKNISGYNIRPIQLISLLFLTKNEPKLGGIFLQINTGEGKSLIIQFLAAYLSLLNNKVDIISSSIILANRDAENEDIIKFYSELNLTVGCASKDEYDKNIVYGDTQEFEAGILRDEFKKKNIRNHRTFDCVIIDEVDSISLDNIITMTQLTENFPGRSSFYFFYYQILICYCNLINEITEYNLNFSNNQNEFKTFIKKIF